MGEIVSPPYKRYHPRWYRRRIPIFWWVRKLAYTRFITRELTSLGVAYCAVLLLIQAWAIGRGPSAHDRFMTLLGTTPFIVLHIIVFCVVLFHSLTWLNLAPKAMVVRIAGRRLPDSLVAAGHYLAWLGASLLVAWALLAG